MNQHPVRQPTSNDYVRLKLGDMDVLNREMRTLFRNFYDDPFDELGRHGLSYVVADEKHVTNALANLYDQSMRDIAIEELYNYKDSLPCFSELLWNSYGTLAVMIFELSSAFLFTVSDEPDLAYCKRITKVLAIMTSLTKNPDINKEFCKAKLHAFLFPIIKCNRQLIEFEYIKIGSLWLCYDVMSKNGLEGYHFDLIRYLFPACILLCKRGMSLSKISAVNIIHKLLSHHIGKECMIYSPDILVDMVNIMLPMGKNMSIAPNKLLIKHLISCFKCILSSETLCMILQKTLKSTDLSIETPTTNDYEFNKTDEIEFVLTELCHLTIATEA